MSGFIPLDKGQQERAFETWPNQPPDVLDIKATRGGPPESVKWSEHKDDSCQSEKHLWSRAEQQIHTCVCEGVKRELVLTLSKFTQSSGKIHQ